MRNSLEGFRSRLELGWGWAEMEVICDKEELEGPPVLSTGTGTATETGTGTRTDSESHLELEDCFHLPITSKGELLRRMFSRLFLISTPIQTFLFHLEPQRLA